METKRNTNVMKTSLLERMQDHWKQIGAKVPEGEQINKQTKKQILKGTKRNTDLIKTRLLERKQDHWKQIGAKVPEGEKWS